MRVYGSPLGLHTEAIFFLSIAEALKSETDQARVAERAGEALHYIRTAIVHSTWLTRRKRSGRPLKFTLIEWHSFNASSRYRNDKKLILELMRTLRRVRRGIEVPIKAKISAIKFFDALSSECAQKGDASSMAIGDSDD